MSYPSHIRTAVQQVIEAREGAPIDQVLARLYGEGMTQQEIADRLGVSRITVIAWMQRLGLPTHGPGRRAQEVGR